MKRHIAVVGLLGLVVWVGFSVGGVAAQGGSPIEGAWRLVESGPEGGTMLPVQSGLAFYTATHYAFILDQADQPRSAVSDPSSASGDEFRAAL